MRALQCLSLALLFLATAVPSKAQDAAAPPTSPPAPDVPVVPTTLNVLNLYTYNVGQKFALNCTQLASEPKDIYWAKNGTEVTAIPELKGRYELKESVFQMTAKSDENDYGNYTCHKRDVSGTAGGWQVQAKTYAKLDANTNVVEGQKLKLQCKLIGKPYPPVTWVLHEADGSNTTITASDRIKLMPNDQNVTDAMLVIEAAERADAGDYSCVPEGGVPFTTTLRVKDMYAALWPFLGICIEVLILCTIILVYEKRRTKPELDDSDTDNHDQKKS